MGRCEHVSPGLDEWRSGLWKFCQVGLMGLMSTNFIGNGSELLHNASNGY